MKILFLTDNFPPESNAPANRTFDHCVEWVKKGADVTVITCNPNFPKGKLFDGYKNKLYSKEMLSGIKVIRVWSFITSNRGTLKRILDYISFALTSFFASFFVKTDIIVATSPQLFTAFSGLLVSLFKGKPWVMEVRDLWPESILAVEAMKTNGLLNKLQSLVDFLYLDASMIIVVTDSFKKRIATDEIALNKIKVIKNGVDQTKYYPKEPNEELLKQYDLKNKFVIGYIGTHGMAHNLDFILDCALQVTDPSVQFLFIGDGAFKTRLETKKEELNIKNVLMLDSIPSAEVPNYISLLDVALVQLKKSVTFEAVLPSKIFENAAMGKPILLGVEGEAKELIQNYNAGLCFEPENEQEFLTKVKSFQTDPKQYIELVSGALKLAGDYKRSTLANEMLKHLELVVKTNGNSSAMRFKKKDMTKHERLKYRIIKMLDFVLISLVVIVVYFLVQRIL
jgi:glycosyltransferase involved in cell wall biosynthesis